MGPVGNTPGCHTPMLSAHITITDMTLNWPKGGFLGSRSYQNSWTQLPLAAHGSGVLTGFQDFTMKRDEMACKHSHQCYLNTHSVNKYLPKHSEPKPTICVWRQMQYRADFANSQRTVFWANVRSIQHVIAKGCFFLLTVIANYTFYRRGNVLASFSLLLYTRHIICSWTHVSGLMLQWHCYVSLEKECRIHL